MIFGKNDAVLITDPLNVFYLTGFTGSNGQAVITKKGKKYFLTDSRYKEQASKEVKKNYTVKVYRKLEETLRNIVNEEGIVKLGFESKHLTYYQYFFYSRKLGIELLPLDSPVDKLRVKKKKREILRIKKAVEIAETSLQKVIQNLFAKNITEIEFKLLLENEMIKMGATEPSFPTIIASGNRSSLVHGTASHVKIRTDSVIVIDFGAKYKGYCSDKTVTFLNKKSCKEIKDVYTIVKDAKNFAIDRIKQGVKAADIDKIAREHIEKKGYGDFFMHSLGHGVGINVHESPVISSLSDDILESGMVFTVEPGIYINGQFGIRLEDMVLVNDTGVELLTNPAENFDFGEFI